MAEQVLIGGLPPLVLTAPPRAGEASIVEAVLLPGRGFMLLQAVVATPDGRRVEALMSPPLARAALELDGGPEDFAGNKSFSFGGAILAPYANRIRGRRLEARQIETTIDGRAARLPRNWGGRAPGAETYAMHGLILATPVTVRRRTAEEAQGWVGPQALAGWPGELALDITWRLADGGLTLHVNACNVGDTPAAIGIGWHPYFKLPSGERDQALLQLPAAWRCEVNNYDEVLPTGRLLATAGTAYDFSRPRALGDSYLDDCFTGLERPGGIGSAEVQDPGAGLIVRVETPSPAVLAFQVYAPPDQPFVVLEPQFNLADPYGEVWPASVDTGMQRVRPGASISYEVTLTVRLCSDSDR